MGPDEDQETRESEKARTTAQEILAVLAVKAVCAAGAVALWLLALGMFCVEASFRDDYWLVIHGLFCRCGSR
jgi:2-keto-3-deoxy-6-phosphogluconate aldolase